MIQILSQTSFSKVTKIYLNIYIIFLNLTNAFLLLLLFLICVTKIQKVFSWHGLLFLWVAARVFFRKKLCKSLHTFCSFYFRRGDLETTVGFTNLDRDCKMIIFVSILTTFEVNFIFIGRCGSIKNWIELKIKQI
jgi:uncharacterized membrane protein YbhN (UPF0104 family)